MILELLGFKESRDRIDPIHPKDPGLARMFGLGQVSDSGVVVTTDNAECSAAVFACVRLIAETIGTLPFILYERDGENRRKAENLPLYNILRRQPNRFQTAMEFKQMVTGHAVLRGNGYAEKLASSQSSVLELIPLNPDRVRPFWVRPGLRAYEYLDPVGGVRVILSSEMLHIMGPPSNDGLRGLNPLEVHRNLIGLDIAQEQHVSSMIKNGVSPPGVLATDKTLSPEGYKNLRESVDNYHSGSRNGGRFMILEQGMSWEQIGMTLADAEFLSQRKYSTTQIARIFRVPPHLIGDLERATFSNVTEQSLEFVKYSMQPWTTRWEEAVSRDLIISRNQKRLVAEFLYEALLRGSTKQRYEAYSKGIQWGFLSVNDVRKRENLDPIENGNVYLTPSNMVPTGGEDAGAVLDQLKEVMSNGTKANQDE